MGPCGCFVGGDLAGFKGTCGGRRGRGGGGGAGGGRRGVAEIDFVADEDTGEVWVCVSADVGQPSTEVDKTCVVWNKGVGWGGHAGSWWWWRITKEHRNARKNK